MYVPLIVTGPHIYYDPGSCIVTKEVLFSSRFLFWTIRCNIFETWIELILTPEGVQGLPRLHNNGLAGSSGQS